MDPWPLGMIDVDLIADDGGAPWHTFVVTEVGSSERFPSYELDAAVLRACGWEVTAGLLRPPPGYGDARAPSPWALGPMWSSAGARWTATFDGPVPLTATIAHVDALGGPVTPVGGRHDRSPWRFRLGDGPWRVARNPIRAALVLEDDTRRAGAAPFEPTPARRPAF